jgi:hypothetical protein
MRHRVYEQAGRGDDKHEDDCGKQVLAPGDHLTSRDTRSGPPSTFCPNEFSLEEQHVV